VVKGQKDVLQNTLEDMGFIWKCSVSKRKLLVQRCGIIDRRCRYLIKMQEVRANGKPFSFLDKIWADSNITIQNCWQDPGIQMVTDTVSGSIAHMH
jgi:hypothetical protein